MSVEETKTDLLSITGPQPEEFILEFKSIPIRITDPSTSKVKDYTLRELDGKERDTYNEQVGK